MSHFNVGNFLTDSRARRIAVIAATSAALLAGPLLASPIAAAQADGVSGPPSQLAQSTMAPHHATRSEAAKDATSNKPETVEERILSLHAALKITPAEEANWNGVAEAMRENAANMEKLMASKRSEPQQNMTAIEDLKTYREFAQAHVDGLKNLTSAFETLYDSMPAGQQKTADQVFQNFGSAHAHAGMRNHKQQG